MTLSELFICCPHYTKPINLDHTTRFFYLTDQHILVLCGVCQNVVKGAMMTDLLDEFIKGLKHYAAHKGIFDEQSKDNADDSLTDQR